MITPQLVEAWSGRELDLVARALVQAPESGERIVMMRTIVATLGIVDTF